MPTCTVEGCSGWIDYKSASQVCRRHLHVAPHCHCKKCQGVFVYRTPRKETVVEAPPPKVYRQPGMPKLPWD